MVKELEVYAIHILNENKNEHLFKPAIANVVRRHNGAATIATKDVNKYLGAFIFRTLEEASACYDELLKKKNLLLELDLEPAYILAEHADWKYDGGAN